MITVVNLLLTRSKPQLRRLVLSHSRKKSIMFRYGSCVKSIRVQPFCKKNRSLIRSIHASKHLRPKKHHAKFYGILFAHCFLEYRYSFCITKEAGTFVYDLFRFRYIISNHSTHVNCESSWTESKLFSLNVNSESTKVRPIHFRSRRAHFKLPLIIVQSLQSGGAN